MNVKAEVFTSGDDSLLKEIPLDIRAASAVIERRKYSYDAGDSHCLLLGGVNLKGIDFTDANFEGAFFKDTNFEGATIISTHFKMANLVNANFKNSILVGTYFNKANLSGANFEGAILIKAHLEENKSITFDQLSKVRSLWGTKLDENLDSQLREKHSSLFDEHVVTLINKQCEIYQL